MKKTCRSLAIITLLLIPVILFSQIQGRAKMLGIVLDEETGQPIGGVTVKAYFPGADSYFLPFPTTDKDGKWKALFVQTGIWSLDFEKVGYIPQKISYRVVFEMGAQVPLIEIRMKKMKDIVVKTDIVSEVERGDQLYSEKKFQEALAVFSSILEKNPHLYIIKKNIGTCYFAMENYEKALENFLQVQEKQPNRGDLLVAIANTYNNWGKQDQAIEWYKRIPLSEIRDIDTAYNAGVVFSNSGNQADALKYFQKAVEIDPQFADGYYQLGLCRVALGSSAEAIEALKKFIELAPESANAATAKAIIETLTKK
jgi:tetratricopeptide (TPR) repeat protein